MKTPDGGRKRRMVVFTNASRPRSTDKLKFFCKRNAIGWKHHENNAFLVAGLYDALLRLTEQAYVKDWHWDGGGKVLTAQGQSKKVGSHSQDKHR